MTQSMQTIIYPVKDAASAATFFTTLLGVEPYVNQPYYVGFRVGDQEIGLDPHGHSKGMTGSVGYLNVDDIRQSLQQLRDAGAEVVQDVTDVGGGRLIASIQDADGNRTGLMQST